MPDPTADGTPDRSPETAHDGTGTGRQEDRTGTGCQEGSGQEDHQLKHS